MACGLWNVGCNLKGPQGMLGCNLNGQQGMLGCKDARHAVCFTDRKATLFAPPYPLVTALRWSFKPETDDFVALDNLRAQ